MGWSGCIDHKKSSRTSKKSRWWTTKGHFAVSRRCHQHKSKVREVQVQDLRALTLLLKMSMSSQKRIRKVESCMGYSLLIACNSAAMCSDCREADEAVQRECDGCRGTTCACLDCPYAGAMHGREDREEGCEGARGFVQAFCAPDDCFVDRDLAAALGEYCQVTIHYGPAPKGPMERQAQETLDKFLKENKDE